MNDLSLCEANLRLWWRLIDWEELSAVGLASQMKSSLGFNEIRQRHRVLTRIEAMP